MKYVKVFERFQEDYTYRGTILVKLLGNTELWDASNNEFEISDIKYTILSHDRSIQVIYVAKLTNAEDCQEIQIYRMNYTNFEGRLGEYNEIGSHLRDKQIERFKNLGGYFGYVNFCKLDEGTEVGKTDNRKWFEIVG